MLPGRPGVDVNRASALRRVWVPAVARLKQVRLPWLFVAAAATPGVIWIGVLLAMPQGRSAFVLPQTWTGLEMPTAFLWMVAGVALIAFPSDLVRNRLRWVALGFFTLGIGGLLLGYVLPLMVDITSFNAVLYGAWLTQTTASALAVIGLWLVAPPRCTQRDLWGLLAAFTAALALVFAIGHRLPELARVKTLGDAERRSPLPLSDLTAWHWALAVVPLVLVTAAAIGSARQVSSRTLGVWLFIGLVGWGVTQLHDTFWPVAFTPIISQATRLRLGLAAIVAVGALLEMQRVAAERATLLASERAISARLTELNHLRDDFTAIVAHELGTPLAAVRRAAELASSDPLTPSQARALATIAREVGLLDALVADVQLTAAVDRDEFVIHPVPVALAVLLEDVMGYAQMLPGDRVITWPDRASEWVRADPERIAQVLHNLLANATKYAAPGTPIAVQVRCDGPRLRIEVSDHGPGIGPGDLPRIFEKYGRGCDTMGRRQSGAGLGLYLSRQIVRSHGGDLHVTSVSGQGTTFWFDLERLP